MSIVLNEKEWAENAIANRQLGRKPVVTLGRVIRYFTQIEGYKKHEVRKKIEEFLLQCDPNIILVKWASMLDSLVKGADRYPLIEVDGIDIAEEELSVVDSLESRQPKRLAFTLLCVAKYWNSAQPMNNGWVNTADKEIMKMANINTSIRRQSMMLHSMKESGLIGFSRKVDNLNIQVLFMSSDGRPFIHISDFRNIGNQYMMRCGEPYIQCSQCGITIKKRNNSHKYCTDCASEMYIRKSVESVMRQRTIGKPMLAQT
jgi:hypothetical protein